jgi:hypothetical protein
VKAAEIIEIFTYTMFSCAPNLRREQTLFLPLAANESQFLKRTRNSSLLKCSCEDPKMILLFGITVLIFTDFVTSKGFGGRFGIWPGRQGK